MVGDFFHHTPSLPARQRRHPLAPAEGRLDSPIAKETERGWREFVNLTFKSTSVPRRRYLERRRRVVAPV